MTSLGPSKVAILPNKGSLKELCELLVFNDIIVLG